jgi:hypothetical protein
MVFKISGCSFVKEIQNKVSAYFSVIVKILPVTHFRELVLAFS